MPKRPSSLPAPPSLVISFRIQPGLLQRVDDVAAAISAQRPDAIRDALARYCDWQERRLARRSRQLVVQSLVTRMRDARSVPATRCGAWDGGRTWRRDEGLLTPVAEQVTCPACRRLLDGVKG